MDLIIAFIIFIIAMFLCIVTNATMVLALLIGYVCFICVALRRGNKLSALFRLSLNGLKDSLIVVFVLFIIGVLTASWRASGTILFFVYYGIKIITPNLFLIVTFLLTCLLSYAIGTSFGVAGTLGVICMALARSGGVNEIITAGVIMSGIYFGDRCSPASSSMILTAAVTNTDSNINMRQLLRTGWLPAIICAVIYTFLSFQNPLQHVATEIFTSIERDFSISFWISVPALFMLILPLFKVDVKIAMGLSILSAGIVSIFLQNMPPLAFFQSCIMGYYENGGSLGSMLNGGGLVSMLEINCILLISCTYSTIFEGTGMIQDLQNKLEHYMVKAGRFSVTALSGILFCAIFCNQTIATTMSAAILNQPYKNQGGTSQELAIDIGNSTIVIAGLIPWAIASSVPLKFMGVGSEALLYAFLLYTIPICYLFTKKRPL
ncbi:Na+/H+ antiporter NhaC family protein [Sinanaerobacter chloroacetimidivorans]|uniref:Na+/H+ antiporter NhaC-like C-terminal domain-containing protein n=1 Tax=Sinanaerobacter chloroacetimidivorans TaxID=2818044 RepID=A0A8J7W6R6_9FIRM|nr:Na+/H+ antiporter NhaC family protein [Sinanaerobacter chloroacetimidivorans]MBR0599960.1 hypothetical protein [Sinanaerobacter chloroacetimidivorans]